MTDKKFFLFTFFVLVVISLSFLVSAATTISPTLPAVNFTNISGSTALNVTIFGGGGAGGNTTGNVTFYYKPWSYASNATWIEIATVNNASPSQWYFSTTWDTTAIADGKNYTLNFTAYNYVTLTVNATNVSGNMTVDNTPPTIAVYGIAPTVYANGTSIKTSTSFSNNLTLSVYVTDATVGVANTSGKSVCFINVNGGVNHTVPLHYSSLTTGWCNATDTNVTGLNITSLTDGNKTINIYLNDTIGVATATNGSNRLNSTLVVQIDTTNPTATATCSPTTVSTGDSFPCSCSGTDATSGVGTTTGSSTSGTVTSTSSTGSFTYTCSITDNGGLTQNANKTYSVVQTPGSGTGSGGATVTKKVVYSNSLGEILPSEPSVVKGFSADVALKEITITVDNPAQSVKVTVTKYDGKPAEVSVSKTGKVYQYMQINVSNVKDKLNNAKITAKVEKAWVNSNSLNKDNIVVSKFDESAEKWDELVTTYASEDDTYYYYTAEVNSFSFFAVSEKAVVAATDTGSQAGDAGVATTTLGSKTWLWIVLGIVVVVVVAWLLMRKK